LRFSDDRDRRRLFRQDGRGLETALERAVLARLAAGLQDIRVVAGYRAEVEQKFFYKILIPSSFLFTAS